MTLYRFLSGLEDGEPVYHRAVLDAFRFAWLGILGVLGACENPLDSLDHSNLQESVPLTNLAMFFLHFLASITQFMQIYPTCPFFKP